MRRSLRLPNDSASRGYFAWTNGIFARLRREDSIISFSCRRMRTRQSLEKPKAANAVENGKGDVQERVFVMRSALGFLVLITVCSVASAQDRPPFHLWLEPEWFDGVKGSFAYWT